MKLTRERALKLHKLMWMDMQDELGDNPSHWEREEFKKNWCKEHIGSEIENDCFLCEYTKQYPREYGGCNCSICPIEWKSPRHFISCEAGKVIWYQSPISEILALSERKVDE